jgi:hypothetical protein
MVAVDALALIYDVLVHREERERDYVVIMREVLA